MDYYKKELKKDVRLQVFVTSGVDDKLTDMAEIMGLSKNEVVRVAIAQYMAAYENTVRMITKEVNKELNRVKGDIVKS